tara:strand:+ start:119810 stop:121054 length:1245 start_codon:yes stop_codon:yes gene_type:complete
MRTRRIACGGAVLGFALITLLPQATAAQDTAPPPAMTAPQQHGNAVAGTPGALYELGVRYHNGDGVLADYAKAAELFSQAAQQGHTGAQNHLARYYFEGLGVAQDRAKALQLLEQAASDGTPQHLFDLALVLEKDAATVARAAELYAQAVEAGHPDAPVNLGVLYQNGMGVAQDFARAAALYQAPAERNHPRALNNLGALHVRGNGVPQDYVRAAEYFTAAANQGLTEALANLGVLYENGFGVPVDEARAADLYRQAGRGNSADPSAPQGGLGPIYDPRLLPPDTSATGLGALQTAAQLGDPVAQFQMAWLLTTAPDAHFDDHRQAAELFQRGADLGHGPSMANLGVLYFQGTGLPQDYELGQMWLLRAASAGVETAKTLSNIYSARMTSAQINNAQARAADEHGSRLQSQVEH